ncbi:MAG: hypothetical protein O2960_17275 [Verrucomicrobia bacterium]|nr:hypothetical protein [Verrucomicrobiota bacterium]
MDPATGAEFATLEAPYPQGLSWLSFSPDGTRLAAAAETKQIQLWDLRWIRRQLAAMNLDWESPPYYDPENSPAADPLSLN